jgi:hypothetical protein
MMDQRNLLNIPQYAGTFMRILLSKLTWHAWVAVILLTLTLLFFGASLVTLFACPVKYASYCVEVAYTFATILIAWIAVFGPLIVDELRKPNVDISFSYDSAECYGHDGAKNWFLSLTVENSGRSPAKDAIVKCDRIAPPPLESIRSSNDQPLSPIPLKWAYWDAYMAMYGTHEGPKRSLHRTIYRRDTCGFISIRRSHDHGGSQDAQLQLVISPNNEEWRLKEQTEYTITLLVEAENYRSDKTWEFKVKWSGHFPENHDDLRNAIEVSD